MTEEELRQAARDLVERTRAEQGLPPKVDDVIALEQVATLVRSVMKSAPRKAA